MYQDVSRLLIRIKWNYHNKLIIVTSLVGSWMYRWSSAHMISPNTDFTPMRFLFRDKKIHIYIFSLISFFTYKVLLKSIKKEPYKMSDYLTFWLVTTSWNISTYCSWSGLFQLVWFLAPARVFCVFAYGSKVLKQCDFA